MIDYGEAERSDDGLSLLTIDLGAIAANYQRLRSIAAPAICAAVVKADAYGLGADRVAATLRRTGCRTFFVATVTEGRDLRQTLGRDATIAVLNGLGAGSVSDCLVSDLTPVLSNLEQIGIWAAAARRSNMKLPAALQFDTGMSRLGLSMRDLETLLAGDQLLALSLSVVMSHLACADEPHHPANAAQAGLFETMASLFPTVPASLAASSGIFIDRRFHFNMVRPGAALYGIAPQRGVANPMHPVVRMQGRIVQTRTVPAGTAVGYGYAAHMDRDSVLATVAIGYADGLPRSAAGRATAFARGHKLPVVGRISMDSLVIDITALAPSFPLAGDFVDLIGPDHDLDAAAIEAGTIGYELLTNLGRRFRRVYVDDQKVST